MVADITEILSLIERGEANVANDLLPLVYDELRSLAANRLKAEKPGHTLQATALVHEAYVRLVDQPQAQQWNSKGHFFAAASEAMRRILVEQARAKGMLKRGGNAVRVPLDERLVAQEAEDIQILAIHEALGELEQHDEIAAQLVKLRYFGGMSHQEAALALGITRGTADRQWRLARAWLYKKLR